MIANEEKRKKQEEENKYKNARQEDCKLALEVLSKPDGTFWLSHNDAFLILGEYAEYCP